jgi:hypothetical protein
MDKEKNYLRSAPAYYQELVTRITELSGMKHVLHACETNAAEHFITHHTNGIPVLGYNPEFISRVSKKNKWAPVALFANEVLYHRNLDLHGKYICEYYDLKLSKPARVKKINRDFFVGKTLRHEGATLNEALDFLTKFARFSSDESRDERMELMTEGWRSEDEKQKTLLPVHVPVSLPAKKDVSGKEIAALLFGLIIYLFKE